MSSPYILEPTLTPSRNVDRILADLSEESSDSEVASPPNVETILAQKILRNKKSSRPLVPSPQTSSPSQSKYKGVLRPPSAGAQDSRAAAVRASTLEKQVNDLKALLESQRSDVDLLKQRNDSLAAQNAALARDLEELRRGIPHGTARSSAPTSTAASKQLSAVRVENQTLRTRVHQLEAELQSLKENGLASLRDYESAPPVPADSDQRLSVALRENAALKQERADFLKAFASQGRLIDLMKRQRAHLEAATVLRLSVDEFSKSINLPDASR